MSQISSEINWWCLLLVIYRALQIRSSFSAALISFPSLPNPAPQTDLLSEFMFKMMFVLVWKFGSLIWMQNGTETQTHHNLSTVLQKLVAGIQTEIVCFMHGKELFSLKCLPLNGCFRSKFPEGTPLIINLTLRERKEKCAPNGNQITRQRRKSLAFYARQGHISLSWGPILSPRYNFRKQIGLTSL